MGVRRWLTAAVVLITITVVASLIARQSPLAGWLVYAGWAGVIVAILVRALRPGARGHRLRSAAAPALNGMDEVQALYLGRPDVGPMSYGSDGPATTQLAIDRVEPDPADLRGTGPTTHRVP